MEIKNRIKYFDNKIWFLDDENVWQNSSFIWDDKTLRRSILGSIIRDWHIGDGLAPMEDNSKTKKELNDAGYFSVYTKNAYKKPVKKISKDILMSFTNGYLDKEGNWHEEIVFDTSQIPRKYNKNPAPVKEIDEFLNWFCNGNENKIKSVTASLLTTLVRRNDSVLTILYSKLGGTGKTTIGEVYKNIAKKNVMRIKTENILGKSAERNKFAITGISGKTGLLGEELPTNLNQAASDLLKDLVDEAKEDAAKEDKNENAGETENLASLVITTNRISKWYEPDGALIKRSNVIFVKPDMENIPDAALVHNSYKLKTDEALDYLLSISINNYFEAKKKWRAEGFRFGLPDTMEYWNQVKESDSVMMDFAQYGLDTFLEIRESDFIKNERIKLWYSSWKHDNFHSSVTTLAMKKKMVEYIGQKTGCEAKLNSQKKENGKVYKGIYIEGLKNEDIFYGEVV